MIKLFKSHSSIGKSILTIDRIFQLADDEVVLVEDSMSGFRTAKKLSKKTNKPLRFGLRLETVSDGGPSKVIYFAKNSDGARALRNIYTKAFTTNAGVYKLDKNDLNNIQVVIPFYDSYIHRNIHNFGSHELDLDSLGTIYLNEDNHHPFDYQIKSAMKDQKIESLAAKSIYYEKKEDFPAFQFYKSTCNRKYSGKPASYERPELKECCSDEFCLEAIENNP